MLEELTNRLYEQLAAFTDQIDPELGKEFIGLVKAANAYPDVRLRAQALSNVVHTFVYPKWKDVKGQHLLRSLVGEGPNESCNMLVESARLLEGVLEKARKEDGEKAAAAAKADYDDLTFHLHLAGYYLPSDVVARLTKMAAGADKSSPEAANETLAGLFCDYVKGRKDKQNRDIDDKHVFFGESIVRAEKIRAASQMRDDYALLRSRLDYERQSLGRTIENSKATIRLDRKLRDRPDRTEPMTQAMRASPAEDLFEGASGARGGGYLERMKGYVAAAEKEPLTAMQTCHTPGEKQTPARARDEEIVRTIRGFLLECAKFAERLVNDEVQKSGCRPSEREWCQQEFSKDRTNAMWLGKKKEIPAEACVQKKLDEFGFTPVCTIEAAYRDSTTRIEFIGSHAVESDSIRPDVVVHKPGDPTDVVAVFDFKFPCPPTNAAQWGKRKDGTPQDVAYRRVLRVSPRLIAPNTPP